MMGSNRATIVEDGAAVFPPELVALGIRVTRVEEVRNVLGPFRPVIHMTCDRNGVAHLLRP